MNITSYYFLVLDIETSTLKDINGEPTATWLSYGCCNLYDRDGDTWERCRYRTWEELALFLNKIQQKFMSLKILCFVHNLGYEFDFLMKNLSRPKNFLSNSTHATISSTLEDFKQIEFRCTLRLTMKSLQEIGEIVNLPKLDNGYELINPEDEVSEENWEYCCRDCDIVAKYVSQVLLKEYGSMKDIPLTKTGRVRKVYNQYYADYVKKLGEPPIWDIEPPEDCYEAMNDAFAGGICTSNPMFTGMVLHKVKSKDEASAYPYAQLSEEYPYTIEKELSPNKSMLNEKFWIAKIKFTRIRSKFNWGWLSVSKMNDYDALSCRFFNGKLLNGNWCIRTITNVDYESIKLTYAYDEIEVLEFYHMKDYGELPEPYINTIKEFGKAKYDYKNKLKKIDESHPDYFEMNIEYMQVKGDYNSIYGMTVQKLVHQEYYIDENFVWKEKPLVYKPKGKHIKRNFLFGVYVTAYARRNWVLAVVTNCPLLFVYGDTDSVKYIGECNFIDTNKILPEKYLSYNYLKGLGRFEDDGEYEDFVTYGAKKYCYKKYGDDNIYLTVAGLPKYKADEEMDILFKKSKKTKLSSVKDFRLYTIFNNCKLGKKYITIENTFELDDDYNIINMKSQDEDTWNYLKQHKIYTNGGVALFPTSYTLDMSGVDKLYIIETRRVFNKWVEELKTNGIDLTEYCGMMLPIELSSENAQTAKHTRLKNA